MHPSLDVSRRETGSSSESADDGPVAIIPAAGLATRLGRLAGSKELLPIGFERCPTGGAAPRPVIVHLLDRLRSAGVDRAMVVLRSGKWDIPTFLGDGAERGIRIAYTALAHSPHVPFSVAAALPWAAGRIVALGFADILFEPAEAYARVLDRLRASNAELVLGLFPTDRSEKTDMVQLDDAGRPVALAIKQPGCALRYTWSIAVWRPAFSDWLACWTAHAPSDREVHFGDAIQAALDAGRAIEAVAFEDGEYLDIGTPEDLERAVRHYDRAEDLRNSP